MKFCPKCKTENPKAASFCRHCRYEFPEATKNGTSVSPRILSFKLQESDYTIGSIIHFEWTVENANVIKLNEYDVTSNGTAEMTVEKTESINLTAENDYDKTTRTIRLLPRPLPSIRLFTASNTSIRAGQEVNLKWEFRYVTKAILISSEREIDVTNKTFIKVTPSNTETYQLICSSCDERIYVEQSIQVRVVVPVVIRGFYADKDVIVESDKVTLTWNVENATSLMLYPLMKDVMNQRRYEVSPSRTTEYRLVAMNNISQEEASLSIGVRQLPKIDMKFVDSFSKIEMPSCNVNMSFLSDSLKKSRVDEWMTTKPIESIKLSVRLNSFFRIVKSLINKIRFPRR